MNENSQLTRRDLVKLGALPAAGALAGCTGGDDDGGTDTATDTDEDGLETRTATSTQTDVPTADPTNLEGVKVEGQQLTLPVTSLEPSEMTFLYVYSRRWSDVDSNLDSSHEVFRLTHQSAMAGRWTSRLYWENVGKTVFQHYSDFQINRDTVEITIADDAVWSDGVPITAKDVYAQIADIVVARHVPKNGTWEPGPSNGLWSAPYSVDMPNGPDGKEIIVNVQPSWVEQGGWHIFPPGYLYYHFGYKFGNFTAKYPYHVEPYKSIGEDAIELYEMKDTDPEELVDHELWMGIGGRHDKYVTPENVEKFSKGENVVSNGAWTVDQIKGNEGVRLVPNEEHRGYGQLNFDELFLEYSEENERTIASLAANRFDYGEVNVRPSVAEQFPDAITQKTSPATYGSAIGINHRDDHAFSDYRVRHAIMYVLNKEDIATNYHPTATEPVKTPGWDHWGIQNILDKEWAEENLTTYEQDREKAEALLQDAGLERNSDDVWVYEDEPVSYTLPSAEDNPVVENTFASQLSNFGIPTEVQTFDSATHRERILGDNRTEAIEEKWGGSGPYDMWSSQAQTSGFAGPYNHIWMEMYRGVVDADRIRQRNWLDHETQEELISGTQDGDPIFDENGHLNQRAALDAFTIDYPAPGDPHGERSNTHAAPYMGGLVSFGDKRTRSPWPELDSYDAPNGEMSKANGEHWLKTWSWFVNWFIPAWPLVLKQDQMFVNTGNWLWPNELRGEDNRYLWDYFDQWNANHLASQNRVLADPQNPKGDAEVVER